MNPNSNGWYVALPDGQALGPYERSELLKLRGTGQISDDSLVWTLDLAEWVPLKRALPAGTGPTTTPAQAHEARRTEARANATQRTHPSPATASKTPAASRASTAPKTPAVPSTPAAAKPAPLGRPAEHLTKAFAALRSASAMPATASASGLSVETTTEGQRALIGLRRLLARLLDLAVLGGVLWAVITVAAAMLAGARLHQFSRDFVQYSGLALILLGLLVIPLEALLVSLGGYTPGKAIFGLRVVSRNSKGVPLDRSFSRAAQVFLRGMALMIPPFFVLTMGMALRRLQIQGFTSWDDDSVTDVRATPLSSNRWWFGLAALVFAYVLLIDNAWIRVLLHVIFVLR